MSLALVCATLLGTARPAHADVIMTAANLDEALTSLERLSKDAAGGAKAAADEALFKLGAEADALATLMNQEVEAHGMQERALIERALSRTKELQVGIAYNRDKRKFFYDGAAFTRYLARAPRGIYAAPAQFQLLAYQFYTSTGADPKAVAASAAAKQAFLTRYPKFEANAELRLYLAIDYRDLYRHAHDAKDAAGAARYLKLARAEYQTIASSYPGSEQASTATQLLRRLDEELKQAPAGK